MAFFALRRNARAKAHVKATGRMLGRGIAAWPDCGAAFPLSKPGRGLAEAWADAGKGGLGLEARIALRLAASWASLQAREVVDAVYHAAGATAIFASNPFERRFRDIHALSQQVQANVANFEILGQCLLGLEPGIPRVV